MEETSRIVLLGDNGNGKTTIMRALAAAAGHPIASPVQSGNVRCHRLLKVGYFCQDHMDILEPKSTALSQILTLMGPGTTDQEGRALLARFGLQGSVVLQVLSCWIAQDTPSRGQTAETLSGGQRSRLGFAMMTVNNPQVILLDEPTVRCCRGSDELTRTPESLGPGHCGCARRRNQRI